MKLSISSVNPTKLFRNNSKKSSRSEPRSFSASSSSDDSISFPSSILGRGGGGSHSKEASAATTPTSVLPPPLQLHQRSLAGVDICVGLEEAFRIIDRNGDGKITKSELTELFFWIGAKVDKEDPSSSAPADEIVEMMREIDVDGDGCISLEEFRAVGSVFGAATAEEELREAFEVFDADHDGKISAEELLKVFSAIGDGSCTLEDCRSMIGGVDVDGDGFVCFEEFKLMMEISGLDVAKI